MRPGGTTTYLETLKIAAVAAATINSITMYIGAITTDWRALLVGMIGAGVSTFGWVFFTEEAETMEEKKATYRDVATRLRWEIHNEDSYFPGRRLPTTRELAERFKVTRRTIGRALKELATEGLIDVVHGRGCYVAGGEHDDRPRDRVERYILSNTRPEAFLPTTAELAKQCHVSDHTVLRAIEKMTRQGLLRRNGRQHQRGG